MKKNIVYKCSFELWTGKKEVISYLKSVKMIYLYQLKRKEISCLEQVKEVVFGQVKKGISYLEQKKIVFCTFVLGTGKKVI